MYKNENWYKTLSFQKRKTIISWFSLVCGIWKTDTSELIYKTEIDSDIENKFMVTKGGEPRRQWHPTPVLLPGRSIPWMEEPGGLQTMGSLRVGHDWATSLSLFTFTHWRRKWQPTPVFLPGESQGQRSLEGCHLWGRTESDTTEVT